MFGSVFNFLSTYLNLVTLVFRHEKKNLILIVFWYLLSFALLGLAFIGMLFFIKDMFLGDDSGLTFLFHIDLLNIDFELSKPLLIGALVVLYTLSSLLAYLVEKKWFVAIKKIVHLIVLEKNHTDCKKTQRSIRKGAIATIRVSAVVLSVVAPIINALFSLVFLCFVWWELALVALFLTAISGVQYISVARKTKAISSGVPDEDEGQSSTENIGVKSTSDQLLFLSNMFQLKARSKLIANSLVVYCVSAALTYFIWVPYDSEALFKIGLGFALTYVYVNSLRSLGSKAVPLARQYLLVQDFIMVELNEIKK